MIEGPKATEACWKLEARNLGHMPTLAQRHAGHMLELMPSAVAVDSCAGLVGSTARSSIDSPPAPPCRGEPGSVGAICQVVLKVGTITAVAVERPNCGGITKSS